MNRLVAKGVLCRLQKGLYYAPKQSVFGEVPPAESELLKAFFRDLEINNPFRGVAPNSTLFLFSRRAVSIVGRPGAEGDRAVQGV